MYICIYILSLLLSYCLGVSTLNISIHQLQEIFITARLEISCNYCLDVSAFNINIRQL